MLLGNNHCLPATEMLVFAQITVTDVNDNPPEPLLTGPTRSGVTVSLSEEIGVGNFVHQFACSDIDSGENALCFFEAIGSNLFSVGLTTGVVTLNETLDFDTATTHTLNVQMYVLNRSSQSNFFTLTYLQFQIQCAFRRNPTQRRYCNTYFRCH